MSHRNRLSRRGVRVAMASLSSGVLVWCLGGYLTPSSMVAAAAQAAPAVDVQTVHYPSIGGVMIEAYVARPKGAAKSPAVIVVHDDLGANQTFRDLTQQLAQAGFVAMAPNLPSRTGTPAADAPTTTPTPVAGLRSNLYVEDVKAGFAFLQKDAGVDATRISAIGVGWGGFPVWRLAEQTPTLHRAVIYYGIVPTDDDQLKTIRASILGQFAEQDYFATMRVLKAKKLLGDRFSYNIYPTGRGFVGGGTGKRSVVIGEGGIIPSNPAQAAAAAKESWAKTLDFLRNGPSKK